MADKEKKILCIEMESPFVKGGSRNLCSICATIKRYKSWPTREQAIEKMAKAIFTQIWGLPNNRFDLAKSSVKLRNRKLAEAALNSLLDEQNRVKVFQTMYQNFNNRTTKNRP